MQTLATAELEANTTTRLAEEKLLLATQTLQEKDRNKETLETMEVLSLSYKRTVGRAQYCQSLCAPFFSFFFF